MASRWCLSCDRGPQEDRGLAWKGFSDCVLGPMEPAVALRLLPGRSASLCRGLLACLRAVPRLRRLRP